MKKRIDREFKLPCDFVVGHVRFRKGVTLETVRAAAERWLKASQAATPIDGDMLRELIERANRVEQPSTPEKQP